MSLNEIERSTLEAHLNDDPPPSIDAGSSVDSWARFGLRLALISGAAIRERRRIVGRDDVVHKSDGSPATDIEHAIEERLRAWLLAASADVCVVGEETGGSLPEAGTAVVIDPIDGTRAFLGETEAYALSLAVIHDREPILAVISNPVTGEIAWSTVDDSRILRLSVFGEEAASCSLRAHHPIPGDRPLVHLHPSRSAASTMAALYRAWGADEVAMVRSAGGSPAWSLVEAGRGHFAYVNLWGGAAEPYDLAAGVFTVRSAGADVVSAAGLPIDPLGHEGPFIAAIDSAT